jgi:hypothetical protein
VSDHHRLSMSKLTELSVYSFMRPSTPHYVLTVEDSITYGRHFYSASTISDSVYGILHSFVLGIGVTNTLHDNTKTLMRRIMAMWYIHFVEAGEESPSTFHSDWLLSGLLTVFSLGATLSGSDDSGGSLRPYGAGQFL